jgi:hypothetical protein
MRHEDQRLTGTGIALAAALIGGAGPWAAEAAAAQSSRSVLDGALNAAFGLSRSASARATVHGGADGSVLAFLEVDGRPSVLWLTPHSVRAADYRILVQGADGSLRPVPPGPQRTLRGEVLGSPGTSVAAALLDDGLHARIAGADGGVHWLEPVRGRVAGAAADLYVLYHEEDVLAPGGTCGLEALPGAAGAEGAGGDAAGGGASAEAGGSTVAELACDADYEYFLRYGSVSAVEDRINSVINTVNAQYERDVQITHAITTIIVRTAEPDPYASTDPNGLLNEFRNHWNASHGSVQRDTAHLFTGKELDGNVIGIAWLNAVCTSYGYGVSQSDFSSNFASVTDLTAHELGHNWGADHCTCSGYTMNPYITSANRFHPDFTIPEVVAFRDSRSCLDSPPPAPTGGCCTGPSCSVLTQSDCAASGGTYLGDGSDCAGSPCGGDALNLATADLPTGTGSVSAGSYLDTRAADDVYESLLEGSSGGKPSQRRSLLRHVWTVNVAPGPNYEFVVEAHHGASADNDHFVFSYSLDNVNFSPMLTVTGTVDDDVPDSCGFPEDVEGTLYVSVEDTDRTQGNGALDTLHVDHLAVLTLMSGPDLTPPPAPRSLSASAGDGFVSLDWADVTTNDLDGYVVYRSTSAGGPFAALNALLVPASDYLDAAVSNGTTYFYVVSGVDSSGNESAPSAAVSATPRAAGTAPASMHVQSLLLSTAEAGKGYKRGRAEVSVVDDLGDPVPGAVVTGTFTGSFNETVSATTGSDGVAVLLTASKRKGGLSFEFCVDGLSFAGLVYDPSSNSATCGTW